MLPPTRSAWPSLACCGLLRGSATNARVRAQREGIPRRGELVSAQCGAACECRANLHGRRALARRRQALPRSLRQGKGYKAGGCASELHALPGAFMLC